jgi:hypothetical protein
MRFALFYDGSLSSNGSRDEKHQIRLALHAQLEKLWQRPPLSQFPPTAKGAPSFGLSSGLAHIMPVGAYEFVPLVISGIQTVLDIELTFLREGAPGQVVYQGGDMDNRLKTLFDALHVPQANQLPGQMATTPGRVFCLAEDDGLIANLRVRTHELLDSSRFQALAHPGSGVVLVIEVTTRNLYARRDNMLFA